MSGIPSPSIVCARALLAASVGLRRASVRRPVPDRAATTPPVTVDPPQQTAADGAARCAEQGARGPRCPRPGIRPRSGVSARARRSGQSGAALAVLSVAAGAARRLIKRPAAWRSFRPRRTGTRPSPTPSRTCSTTFPASWRSRNGARTPGSRSAAPACRAISICAASSSTWTASRSTPPTAMAISRKSIRPPIEYVEVYKGAQRAAVRRQFAGRRHQFRDADRARCQPVRRQRRHRQLRLSAAAGEFRRRQRAVWTVSSPARGRRRTDSVTTAAGTATRVSGNVGYQISPDVETRFYFNVNEIRQRIPGSVTKARR